MTLFPLFGFAASRVERLRAALSAKKGRLLLIQPAKEQAGGERPPSLLSQQLRAASQSARFCETTPNGRRWGSTPVRVKKILWPAFRRFSFQTGVALDSVPLHQLPEGHPTQPERKLLGQVEPAQYGGLSLPRKGLAPNASSRSAKAPGPSIARRGGCARQHI